MITPSRGLLNWWKDTFCCGANVMISVISSFMITASRTMKSVPSATTSHLVHAPGGRKSRASLALSTRPAQTCARVNLRSPLGFTGTVAVEKIMMESFDGWVTQDYVEWPNDQRVHVFLSSHPSLSDGEDDPAEGAVLDQVPQRISRFGQREGLRHDRCDRAGLQ